MYRVRCSSKRNRDARSSSLRDRIFWRASRRAVLVVKGVTHTSTIPGDGALIGSTLGSSPAAAGFWNGPELAAAFSTIDTPNLLIGAHQSSPILGASVQLTLQVTPHRGLSCSFGRAKQ